MAMSFGAPTGHGGVSGQRKAVSYLICLTVFLLSIGVQAEHAATRSWEVRSGLHSFFGGHLVRLTIFEAGAATVVSRAIVELRNDANRVVARRESVLTRSSPVRLDLRLGDNAGLVQLRAVVIVTTESDGLTAPQVTFEDIHPTLGLVNKLDPPCGPGSLPVDPQAAPQASCPGWLVLTSTPE